MSIVINTPNGNIGRALCNLLLDVGEPITVISRTADKVKDLTARGARLVLGSTEDPAVLDSALSAARALFFLTPPVAQPNYLEWSIATARTAAHVARKHGCNTAVLISSVGAHSGRGSGPVGAMLEVEHEFFRQLPNVVSLRAASFMENLLRDAQGIRNGTIYSPLPADVAMPMVATKDVAAMAASYLLSRWHGHVLQGVHGPRDLTQLQVVAELSRALGRTIHYQQVPVDAARQAMLGFGMPEFMVSALCEMFQAVLDGRMNPAEARTPHTTTPTSLREVIETVIKPALHHPGSGQ